MKTFIKYAVVAVFASIAGAYVGYLYAEYEDAYYCEKQAAPRVAL